MTRLCFVAVCCVQALFVFSWSSVEGACDHPDRDSCTSIPGVCQDQLLATSFCPHMCGLCTTTPPTTTTPATTTHAVSSNQTCVDLVVEHMCEELASICESSHARVICPRFCGFCHDPTTAASTTQENHCHRADNRECDVLPNVCKNSTLAHILCPHYCGYCESSKTTVSVTTTPPRTHAPTTTPLKIHTSTTTASSTHASTTPTRTHAPKITTSNTHAPTTTPTGTQAPSTKPTGTHAPKSTSPRTHALKSNLTTAATHTRTTAATATVVVETCVDSIGNGLYCSLIPSICNNPYAVVLCRRHCHLCKPHPNALTPTPDSAHSLAPGECVDHVLGDVPCAALPSVCGDAVGRLICPHYCGFCESSKTTVSATPSRTHTPVTTLSRTHAPMTTPLKIHASTNKASHTHAPTTTPAGTQASSTTRTGAHAPKSTSPRTHAPKSTVTTAASTHARTTAVTATAVVETCVDSIGNGLFCNLIPNICNDPYAVVVCRRHCGFCKPHPNALTPTPDSAHTLVPGECVDHVLGDAPCAALPSVCGDAIGRLICPRYCGFCATTPTTPLTTTTMTSIQPTSGTTAETYLGTCVDNLGNGMHCRYIPGICARSFGKLLCPASCGFCTPSNDTNVNVPTTSPEPATLCSDKVVNHFGCADLPLICTDPLAPVICPLFCKVCDKETTTHPSVPRSTASTSPPSSSPATSPTHALPTSTVSTTVQSTETCVDHVGHGFTCSKAFCSDPVATVVCRKTCGFCECEDKIEGLTCQQLVHVHGLDPCQDHLGHEVCARFCHFC